jgi:hypothetical protein
MVFTVFIIPGVSVDNSDFDETASYYMKGNIIEAYGYF